MGSVPVQTDMFPSAVSGRGDAGVFVDDAPDEILGAFAAGENAVAGAGLDLQIGPPVGGFGDVDDLLLGM